RGLTARTGAGSISRFRWADGESWCRLVLRFFRVALCSGNVTPRCLFRRRPGKTCHSTTANEVDRHSAGGGAPLVLKDGADQLVVPYALHELVLAKMRFLAHADPFHHPPRGDVAAMAPGIDAMRSGTVEGHGEQHAGRFRGEAVAVMVGMEDVPDLDLP